jgi:hypothetical protein
MHPIVPSVNRFTASGPQPPDTDAIRVNESPVERIAMTAVTADQIRFLLIITAMIGIAVAMGVAPSLCATL